MTDPVKTRYSAIPNTRAAIQTQSPGPFLTLLMLVVYYGYIALMPSTNPFWPSPLARA